MSFVVFAAAASLLTSPCDVISKSEAEKVLHGAAVDVPPEEMGEETAPSCLFATKGRAREMKISIWSKDELPVVGMPDAASYYAKLKADAAGAAAFANAGDKAFSSFAAERDGASSGVVVVLMGERLFSFEFGGVKPAEAKALVAQVMARL